MSGGIMWAMRAWETVPQRRRAGGEEVIKETEREREGEDIETAGGGRTGGRRREYATLQREGKGKKYPRTSPLLGRTNPSMFREMSDAFCNDDFRHAGSK